MRKPEILAPAGDFTCLQAALDAGADAVYFGLGTFNMRARSGVNFKEGDLPEIARRCRERGVRAYLALNAIMFEGEAEEIERTIVAARPFVDAFIVADWGVIELCRRHGALLIDSKNRRGGEFDGFLRRCRIGGKEVKVEFRTVLIEYRAPFGKEKKRWFVMGYLPPGTEIE